MLSISKDPIVLLIRIPQTKLEQMHLAEAVSIGKGTEHALCASNSFLWKPELLTTHVSISSNKPLAIGSTELAAYCVLWLDVFSATLEYRATYPEKSTHLNDKKLGAGSIYSLQVYILPHLSGCWALSQIKTIISYMVFLFPSHLRS